MNIRKKGNKRKITSHRFTFLLHNVLPIYILIFLLNIFIWLLITSLMKVNNIFLSSLIFIFNALFTFSVNLVVFYIQKRINYSPQNNKSNINAYEGYLMLFKVKESNFNYQIYYGILLFLFLFLPLDLLFYIIPNMQNYLAIISISTITDSYLLLDNYFQFLVITISIQIMLSISQEILSRGLIAKRGSEYYSNFSAIIIASIYFGLIQSIGFSNINPYSYSFLYPILNFMRFFLIGLILSIFILRKKWIIPGIIAFSLHKIIASHIIWNIFQGIPYFPIYLYLYLPLITISLILFVLKFDWFKTRISDGFNYLKKNFNKIIKSDESQLDRLFRILFDIIFALILFVMSFLILV